MMIGFLLRFSYGSVIVALFSILNAAALIAVGVYKAFRFSQVILWGMPREEGKGLGISIVDSVDTFLVALVLVALGRVAELCFAPENKKDGRPIASWMKVTSFPELRLLI
jgi:uncharacterized membrane protein YqhA